MKPANSHESEEENSWIRSFQEGDPRGFEMLYRAYWKRLFAFVRLTLVKPSAETVEDICQEVMLSIFKNLSQFRFESKFSTYLFTIAMNAVRAHRKKRSAISEDSDRILERLESPKSLESQVWHEEFDRTLIEGIEKLPDKERTVWILHETENLNWEDIARVTGNAVRAAQAHKEKAQIFLRNWLREKGFSLQGDAG